MSSTSVYYGRPGLSFGGYPERPPDEQRPFERWASAQTKRLKTRRNVRPAVIQRVIASIEQAGEALRTMPDDVLQMSLDGLRMRLSLTQAGADQALVVEAFAAIREFADRALGLRHFPSQLAGGWVLYHGMLAQMQTGEGKTLTATLPACTAALCGMPVHVITANDYLAARDAQTMRPIYAALGVSLGVVTQDMDTDARIAAYACDVTYCTNKQVAFDYLRDRIARGTGGSASLSKVKSLYEEADGARPLLLRGLCYAIVDEADSVLIDEARTPLILSAPVADTDDVTAYRQALDVGRDLTEGEHFVLDHRTRRVELTQAGSRQLAQVGETLAGLWTGKRQREELACQALAALHVYVRERQYLVKDNKVQIIDDNTGRLMADRSWERGLHQMIELKEDCEHSASKETLARISYQKFFQRYLKLGGMTGTARGVESELATVYGLPVVSIPTHRPNQRIAYPPRTFASSDKKWAAVVEAVKTAHSAGRPVLVGTRSVEMSDFLGRLLAGVQLPVQVLNAREDAAEAAIVGKAGEIGRITVATNIAGRGTDIHLDDRAKACGGLHVIVTERNEAMRIDRQLIGRCSRQGDPGSFQVFAALDDEIPLQYYSASVRWLLVRFFSRKGKFPGWLGERLMDLPQRAMERRHRQARTALQRQEERLEDMLAFSGAAD